jgi:caspase domain-containing protein
MLTAQAATPGLWTDPDARAERPATLAFVAGISRYDFLDGGATPVPETYGLPQLCVSALSAYRFFEWLRDAYDFADAPLTHCWLLLAPTPAEVVAEPGLAAHLLSPTYDNLQRALVAWRTALAALAPAIAPQSRAFFVFSGHGIQIDDRQQVLLPSDYLDPAYGGRLSRAIDSESVWAGLAAVDAREQFFFLDACRNGAEDERLRQQKSFGADAVFNPVRGARTAHRCAPTFYAAGPGSQAWQPKTPAEGPSIYLGAVLDGLKARAGFTPDCGTTPCSVKMFELQDYLAERVPRLLAAADPRVAPDPAVMGGQFPHNTAITHVTGLASAGGPLPRTSPPPLALDRIDLDGWHPTLGGISMHAVFGHESASAVWNSARVYDLSEQRWLPDPSYLTRYVHRDVATATYRVGLTVRSPNPCWFQIRDHARVVACVLPPDAGPATLFELRFSVAPPAGPWPPPILSFDAVVSAKNPGPLSEAAQLWDLYRARSAAGALQVLEQDQFQTLHEILRGKVDSPLAATIAAIVLVRAERLDLVPAQWLQNLTEWFPERPDGLVLWAEQLLSRGSTPDTSRAAGVLVDLLRRGLPTTAECLALARRQVDDLLRFEQLEARVVSALRILQAAIAHGLPSLHSSGLFVSHSGLSDDITPELVRVQQR